MAEACCGVFCRRFLRHLPYALCLLTTVPVRTARLRIRLPARSRLSSRVQNRVVVLHGTSTHGRRAAVWIRAHVLSRRSGGGAPGAPFRAGGAGGGAPRE